MSEDNVKNKTEQEVFNEQLVKINETTTKTLEATRSALSTIDLSHISKARENYIANIAPAITTMAKTLNAYREMSVKISETLIQPMLTLQKMVSEITAPLAEFKKRLPEIIAPIIKASNQMQAIKRLGEHQLIWFDSLDEVCINDILKNSDVEIAIIKYLEKTSYYVVNDTIRACRKTDLMKEKKLLFNQSVSAYRKNHCNLACIGFISIIDFLLSEISGDIETKFLKKVEIVVEKMKTEEFLDNFELVYFYIFLSLENTLNSVFAHSDFSKDEPTNLNRHWIAHGRTQRKYTKLDCIKLINLIYALLLVGSFKGGEIKDV